MSDHALHQRSDAAVAYVLVVKRVGGEDHELSKPGVPYVHFEYRWYKVLDKGR